MIIYFDENMSKHLADGFHIIQRPENMKTNWNITVKYLPEEFGYGVVDKAWIPQLGNEGSCVITQDLNISRRKDECALYKKYGVGLFFLREPSRKKGLRIWQMVQVLAKNWEDICRIATEEKRPFGYQFQLSGKMRRLS